MIVDLHKMDVPTPKGCHGFRKSCHPFGIRMNICIVYNRFIPSGLDIAYSFLSIGA